MSIEAADFFEFNFANNDRTETQPAGGGGAGKSSVGDLSFTKYIDFSGGIDDLRGSIGGGSVAIALLLPAVQAAREAARPTSDTACDELQTFVAAQTWDDFFLG